MDPDSSLMSHILSPVSFNSASKSKTIVLEGRERERSNRPPEPTTPTSSAFAYVLRKLISKLAPNDGIKIRIHRALWILQAYYRFLFVTNYELLQVSLLEPTRILFNPLSTLLALTFFVSLQVFGLTLVLINTFLRVTGLKALIDGWIDKHAGGVSLANIVDADIFTKYDDIIEKAKRIFSAGYDCPESELEREPSGPEEHVENTMGTRTRYCNIDVAKTLLVFSSAMYERNDELNAEALIDPKPDIQKQVASETAIADMAKGWGIEFAGISDLNTYGGAFAGLWWDPNSNWIVISFRGTTPFCGGEWLDEVKLTKTNGKAFTFGYVHQGFYDRLFPDFYSHIAYSPYGNILQTIRELAKELKKASGSKQINLYITGHGLGAGTATAFYVRAVKSPSDFAPYVKVCNAYVFGSPRVGDVDFCSGFYSALNQPFGNTQCLYRFVNDTDCVARLPFAAGEEYPAHNSIFNYCHLGEAIVITGRHKPVFTGNRFAPGSSIRLVQDDSQYGYDHEGKNGSSSGGSLQAPLQTKQTQQQQQKQKSACVPPTFFDIHTLTPDNLAHWAQNLTYAQFVHWLLPFFIQDHFPARYCANLDRLQPDNATSHA